MANYPYKRQIIAADVQEVKPFDTSRALESIAQTSANISEATARLSQEAYFNNFEIESRKMLLDAYDRNQNNPDQLAKETQKIKMNLVKTLPSERMRNEAMAKFEIHSLPYMQRAKENLYNQKFEEAQVSAIKKTDLIINDMREQAANLYSGDIALAGQSIMAFGDNLKDLQGMVNKADEKGNTYFSPAQRAAAEEQIRIIMTAGAVPFFERLSPEQQKDFYQNYKDKKTLMTVVDKDSETGFNTMSMNENNTDWPTYEKNLAYFERVINETDKKEKQGRDSIYSQQYAMAKAKFLQGVDMRISNYKAINDSGESMPVLEVFSTLQELNDKATTPFQRRDDGTVDYLLDPVDGEYYEKLKQMTPFLSRIIEDIRLDEAKSNSNFGYGLGLISDLAEKDDTLNDRDISTLLDNYYQEMKKQFNNDTTALMEKRSLGSNQQILQAFRNATISFYSRRGGKIPPTLNMDSVPQQMPVKVYDGGFLNIPDVKMPYKPITSYFTNPFKKFLDKGK